MDTLKSRSNSGQLLDHDVEAKSKEYYHQDPVTGQTIIEKVADVTDIVEANQADYNTDRKWRTDGMALNHVARIPNAILYSLDMQKILANNDIPALKKFLNDYNNRRFRTRPGRV